MEVRVDVRVAKRFAEKRAEQLSFLKTDSNKEVDTLVACYLTDRDRLLRISKVRTRAVTTPVLAEKHICWDDVGAILSEPPQAPNKEEIMEKIMTDFRASIEGWLQALMKEGLNPFDYALQHRITNVAGNYTDEIQLIPRSQANACRQAAIWFRQYEEHHREKHGPDDEKTIRNGQRAAFLENAIVPIRQDPALFADIRAFLDTEDNCSPQAVDLLERVIIARVLTEGNEL